LGILGKVGVIAGGVLAIAGILGIFEPTMKLLKLILMLFFLPALPFFILALKALAGIAKEMAPAIIKLMGKSEELIKYLEDNFKKMFDAWGFVLGAPAKLKEILVLFIGGFKMATDPFVNAVGKIITGIWDILSRIYDAFVKGYNKVASFVGLPQVATGSGGGGSGGGAALTSEQSNFIKTIKGGGVYQFKQLGGVIGENGMFGLHRGERVLSATERGSSRGMQGGINITINNPQIRQDNDIKILVRELDSHLKSELRRRVSYI
jgi:hypothetical protein